MVFIWRIFWFADWHSDRNSDWRLDAWQARAQARGKGVERMGESKSFLALERLINVVGRRHGVYLKAARAELEKAREVLSERFQKEAILKCESALPGEAQAESFPHQGEETGIRDVGAGDGTTTLAEAKVAWMDSIAFSAELSDKPIVSVYANRRACERGNPCIRLSRADPEETWKCTAIRVYVFDADKYDKSYANPCEREDCAAQREVLQELAKEKRDLDLAVLEARIAQTEAFQEIHGDDIDGVLHIRQHCRECKIFAATLADLQKQKAQLEKA